MAKQPAGPPTPDRPRLGLGKSAPFGPAPGGVAIQEILLVEINQDDLTFQFRLQHGAEDLRHSLALDGQQQPVDLLGPKPYRILDGFRRVEAATALRWPSIQAIVYHGLADEEAHLIGLVKNVIRRNLSPFENAYATSKLRKLGESTEEICKHLDLSLRQLQRYEEMLQFPTEIQKLLEDNLVSMAHAKVLADFGPPNPTEWADRCRREAWTVPQLRAALRKAIGKKPGGKEPVYARIEKDRLRLYAHSISKLAPRAEREAAIAQLRRGADFLDEGD